ncbi:MAG: hypothetical protein AVDCRST_MAG95-327, partial [uncultured Adhaeribacter sp.]
MGQYQGAVNKVAEDSQQLVVVAGLKN